MIARRVVRVTVEEFSTDRNDVCWCSTDIDADLLLDAGAAPELLLLAYQQSLAKVGRAIDAARKAGPRGKLP